MQAISDLIKLPDLPLAQKRPLRERSMILNEIYELYSSIQDKKLRHIYNVSLYREWLQKKRIKHSSVNWEIFRKSARCVKTIDIGQFCIRLSHLKEERDLYYILSVAKDRFRREEPVGAWIFSTIKTLKALPQINI